MITEVYLTDSKLNVWEASVSYHVEDGDVWDACVLNAHCNGQRIDISKIPVDIISNMIDEAVFDHHRPFYELESYYEL